MSGIDDRKREILSKDQKYKQQESLDRLDVSSPKFEGYGFDAHSAILESHLFESFIKDQSKLRLMNPLSGKIFNPVGFAMNLKEDITHPTIQQLLTQLGSDLVDGGSFETTDGKTFSSSADTDYSSSIYRSVKDLKEDSNKEKNLLERSLSGFVNKLKETVGAKKPSRSILGQVLAYNDDKLDNLGSQTKTRDFFGDEVPDRIDDNELKGSTNIKGIEENALNYLYSSDKPIKDPIEYYRLKQKIKSGFFASNVRVKKHDDIVDIERRSYGDDNENSIKDRVRNFIVTRTLKLPPTPKGWYENWKFDFSKDYPSPYKIFLGKEYDDDYEKGFINEIYLNNLRNFDENVEWSKWNNWEYKRIRKTTKKESKSDYPIYNISGKYTLEQLKEDGNIYDIRHLQKFIDKRNGGFSNPEDKIMSTDIFDEEQELDTNLYLSFEDIRTNKIVYFRPTIDSITTDVQPTFEEEQFLGRTEGLPSYQTTNKSKSFSFKLYCGTPKEQLLNIKKLNFLDSLCYPIHNSDHTIIKNPLIRINIGTYFKKIGGYITSMTHTINNDEAGWTVDKGNNFMAPKIIDVSISMVIIHNRMPFYYDGETFKSDGEGFQNNYGINYSKTKYLND